ncbi:FeoA family protein [Streptomyces sparsogenes]|uniref:FeoA family protein n=1 Tax=Streptomyces sparsogenes TaxID=67365 RepID=UPI0033F797F3
MRGPSGPLAQDGRPQKNQSREVVVDGAPDVARRLYDLGFTPGTVVEVVPRAPLRDPVVYQVKDYEVCLRREQAACVRTVEAHR